MGMHWLRRIGHKPLVEKRLDSELHFHLEQQIADYIASGLSPDEARVAPISNLAASNALRRSAARPVGRIVSSFGCMICSLRCAAFARIRGSRSGRRSCAGARHWRFDGDFQRHLQRAGRSVSLQGSRPLVTLRVHDLDHRGDGEGEGFSAACSAIRSCAITWSKTTSSTRIIANCEIDVVYDSGENNSFSPRITLRRARLSCLASLHFSAAVSNPPTTSPERLRSSSFATATWINQFGGPILALSERRSS